MVLTSLRRFFCCHIHIFQQFYLCLSASRCRPSAQPHAPGLTDTSDHRLFSYKISQIIQATSGIAGGAFPSSHISGAMVWAFLAIRYFRKMGYVMLPISVGVAVAAIYLGLHHALDSVFGITWFAISYPIGLWLIKIRGEDPLNYR